MYLLAGCGSFPIIAAEYLHGGEEATPKLLSKMQYDHTGSKSMARAKGDSVGAAIATALLQLDRIELRHQRTTCYAALTDTSSLRHCRSLLLEFKYKTSIFTCLFPTPNNVGSCIVVRIN